MKSYLINIGFFLSFSLCSPLFASSSIDFDVVNGKVVFKIVLNDSIVNVMLDTGARMVIIDESLNHNYEVCGKVKSGGAAGVLGGIKNVVRFPFPIIGSSGVDTLEVRVDNLEGLSNFLGIRLDIIVGYDFLKNYILEIDYSTQKLHFCYRCWGLGSFIMPSYTPFELKGDKIMLTGIVNGQPVDNLLIDTGAGTCVISQELQQKLNLPIVEGYDVISVDASGVKTKTHFYQIDKIQLGNATFVDVKAIVLDLSEVNRISGFKRSAIIGHNLLKQCVVIIDYLNNRIAFKKSYSFEDE